MLQSLQVTCLLLKIFLRIGREAAPGVLAQPLQELQLSSFEQAKGLHRQRVILRQWAGDLQVFQQLVEELPPLAGESFQLQGIAIWSGHHEVDQVGDLVTCRIRSQSFEHDAYCLRANVRQNFAERGQLCVKHIFTAEF